MWNKYDHLSRAVLSRVLAPAGSVGTQQEIVTAVQPTDIWFSPAAGREAERTRLGLLGDMIEAPCLIEPFHITPSTGDVLDCVHKQLNLRRLLKHARVKHARVKHAPAQPMDDQPVDGMTEIETLVPRLWLLSPGRPERMMGTMGLTPMIGWPRGFWKLRAPLVPMHLVVLRDLPETRDTLLLRLLGRGKTLARAIHELHALPAHAWERELDIPQLLLAHRIEHLRITGEDEMCYADELRAIFDEWEARLTRRGWAQGERAGRLKTLQEALRGLYQARFGALTPELQTALDAANDIDMLQQWLTPFATRTPAEITALVRERRAGAHCVP